ncbi:MAG: ATP-binding cassette domain-containing protein [Candidatus Omnitrophota bacterium]|nr:ABC transporter ATP-binding protein [Candidatus Omnitrophota bacterium]
MIQANSLTMNYGTVLALRDVSFQIQKGEILGLLGPNGAGKTTLMRILTTYLYPTSGTALVQGFDVKESALDVRAVIGYLPESVPVYPDMLVNEYLRFIGGARGLDGQKLRERLQWVREVCGLKRVWRYLVSEVSKGYAQRIGLAQAIIHDPKVLILDEPTSGLDPLQIIDIRNLIRSLSADKTIVFSTHILQEVEALATRIVIINNGNLIADGTKDELIHRAKDAQRLVFTVKAKRYEVEDTLRKIDMLDEVKFLGEFDNGYVKFWVRAKVGCPIINVIDETIKNKKWPLREFIKEEAKLEEVFITLLNK